MNSKDGRKKLTDEVQSKLLDAVRAGNDVKVAAVFAGVHSSTYFRWMARGGKERSGPYRRFREEVRKAESVAEVHAVALFKREMSGNWRAILAYLERRFPERWSVRRPRAEQPPQQQPSWPDKARLEAARLNSEKVLGSSEDDQAARVAAILFECGALDGLICQAATEAGVPLDPAVFAELREQSPTAVAEAIDGLATTDERGASSVESRVQSPESRTAATGDQV